MSQPDQPTRSHVSYDREYMDAMWVNSSGNFGSALNAPSNAVNAYFNNIIKIKGSITTGDLPQTSSVPTGVSITDDAPTTTAAGEFVYGWWAYIQLVPPNDDLEAGQAITAVRHEHPGFGIPAWWKVRKFREENHQCSRVRLGGKAYFSINVVRAVGSDGLYHIKALTASPTGNAESSYFSDTELTFKQSGVYKESATGLRIECRARQIGYAPWAPSGSEFSSVEIYGDGSVANAIGPLFQGLESQLKSDRPAVGVNVSRGQVLLERDVAAIERDTATDDLLSEHGPKLWRMVKTQIAGWPQFASSTGDIDAYEEVLKDAIVAGTARISDPLGCASWILPKIRYDYFRANLDVTAERRSELISLIERHASDADIAKWYREEDVTRVISVYPSRLNDDSDGDETTDETAGVGSSSRATVPLPSPGDASPDVQVSPNNWRGEGAGRDPMPRQRVQTYLDQSLRSERNPGNEGQVDRKGKDKDL